MNSIIYNPLAEYKKFEDIHKENINKFFNDLVKKSGIDIETNRLTVSKIANLQNKHNSLIKKLDTFKALRILCCITIVLLILVFCILNKKIKELKQNISDYEREIIKLENNAEQQVKELLELFSSDDCLRLIETTLPSISFFENYKFNDEVNLFGNFEFNNIENNDESTIDVLYGEYNKNPFLYTKKFFHELREETYHGYKTIHWTTTRTGTDGRIYRTSHSQTLHATITSPKPYYSNEVVLNYFSQAGNQLSFSRDATNFNNMNDKEINNYVKRKEKKLKKLTDKAIKNNSDFMAMSNSNFEVLFHALDRNNEVQFRSLFSPLAQTNMIDLIRSNIGYGDDFYFYKNNMVNRIITNHSQKRDIRINEIDYQNNSYDIIKDNFIKNNLNFFKSLYFDFAPLWSIPSYQDEPSLLGVYEASRKQLFTNLEYESLANGLDDDELFEETPSTPIIYKGKLIRSIGETDIVCIYGYSYDIIEHIDYVSVFGGDGRLHHVPVAWNEYVAIENHKTFTVCSAEKAIDENREIKSYSNGLCMCE